MVCCGLAQCGLRIGPECSFLELELWDNPSTTLPKALFYALILVVLSYLIPLLTGTGAAPVPLDRRQWTDGYFSDVANDY